jgi:hypothetical protein
MAIADTCPDMSTQILTYVGRDLAILTYTYLAVITRCDSPHNYGRTTSASKPTSIASASPFRPTAPTAPPETVPHYLLARPAFQRQRLQLIARPGTARLTLRLLLAAKADHKPVRDTHRLLRYVL